MCGSFPGVVDSFYCCPAITLLDIGPVVHGTALPSFCFLFIRVDCLPLRKSIASTAMCLTMSINLVFYQFAVVVDYRRCLAGGDTHTSSSRQ